jgi:hypothetical protein
MNYFKLIKIMSFIAVPLSALSCILDLYLGDYFLAIIMAVATVLWVFNYNMACEQEQQNKKD